MNPAYAGARALVQEAGKSAGLNRQGKDGHRCRSRAASDDD